jgi:hypothetical protein
MTATRPIAKTILSLADLDQRFGLNLTIDPQFFPEWQSPLPDLTTLEQTTLDRLLARFASHRYQGTIAEGAVDKLLLSPLLDLVGFYEPEYSLRTEVSVEFAFPEQDEVLRGRIDTLILQEQLWVLVVEAKRTIMVSLAIPQALAYMMAHPNAASPIYGLVSNGDEFIFLKLQTQTHPTYSTSRQFTLFFPPGSQDLTQVCQILKQLKTTIG